MTDQATTTLTLTGIGSCYTPGQPLDVGALFDILDKWSEKVRRRGEDGYDAPPKPGGFTEWELYMVVHGTDLLGNPLLNKTEFWYEGRRVDPFRKLRCD